MLTATFQLAPGLGAHLERELWAAGITRWEHFPPPPALVLATRPDARIRAALERASAALLARDAEALAAMLPRRERWRLYPTFEDEAAFLDVETDGVGEIAMVGVLDRRGPRLYLSGRDLHLFPEGVKDAKLLVTFNGLAFDVPRLVRAFPLWRPPRAHVDLRSLWGRLGQTGGLKLVEAAAGVSRPAHLARLTGRDAPGLWRRHCAGEAGALGLLAEYNLYDAVNLKVLMTRGYNRMLERYRLPGRAVPDFQRGDVLYDLTKELLALEGARATGGR